MEGTTEHRRPVPGQAQARVILLLLATVFGLSHVVELTARQPFPTGSDQDGYLASAAESLRGHGLQRRAPLYSGFLALQHLRLAGQPSAAVFRSQRVLEIVLGAAGLGIILWLLAGAEAGIAAFALALHSRHFVLEPNGSHAFALLFWLGGAVALLTLRTWGRPLAAALFFASCFARSELLLAAFLALPILAWPAIRSPSPAQLRRWLLAGVCCAGLTLFLGRLSAPAEPQRLAVAYKQNFAVRMVEERGLQRLYPSPWEGYLAVWTSLHGRDVGIMDAIWARPALHLERMAAEVRTSLVAVPTTIFALVSPVFALSVVALAGGLRFWASRPAPREAGPQALLPLLMLLLLVPISWVFRSAARYYIPLVPLGLGLGVYVVFRGLPALRAKPTRLPPVPP